MYFLTRLVFYTVIAGTAHSVLWSCWMSHVISSTDICGQSDYYLRSEQRGQRVRGQITKWDRREWVSLLWGTTKVKLLFLSDPSENSRFVSERVSVSLGQALLKSLSQAVMCTLTSFVIHHSLGFTKIHVDPIQFNSFMMSFQKGLKSQFTKAESSTEGSTHNSTHLW